MHRMTASFGLCEGGLLLAAGAQGVVPSHAHHAIQIAAGKPRPVIDRAPNPAAVSLRITSAQVTLRSETYR